MATVRYFAAAAEAAGRDEEVVVAATLGELQDVVIARHGAGLARVLGRCAFVVGGERAGPQTPLGPDAAVDVLPPFAGG